MTNFDYICKCIDKYTVEVPLYPRWSIEIDNDHTPIPLGEEDILRSKIEEILNFKEDYEEVKLYYEYDETVNGLVFICDIVKQE
tara:strand:- start:3105 stop:3356 length:252 start_codon:yes stop_codon:yes gene_type:complete